MNLYWLSLEWLANFYQTRFLKFKLKKITKIWGIQWYSEVIDEYGAVLINATLCKRKTISCLEENQNNIVKINMYIKCQQMRSTKPDKTK